MVTSGREMFVRAPFRQYRAIFFYLSEANFIVRQVEQIRHSPRITEHEETISKHAKKQTEKQYVVQILTISLQQKMVHKWA